MPVVKQNRKFETVQEREGIEVFDRLGQPIKPGTYLTWCLRRGAQMWLTVGVVRSIKLERDLESKEILPTLYVTSISKEESTVGEILIPRRTVLNTPERSVVIPPQIVFQRDAMPELKMLRTILVDN